MQDITNFGEKVSECKVIVLINVVSETYKGVINTIKYDRDTLTLQSIIDSLRSKERELKVERLEKIGGEVHNER